MFYCHIDLCHPFTYIFAGQTFVRIFLIGHMMVDVTQNKEIEYSYARRCSTYDNHSYSSNSTCDDSKVFFKTSNQSELVKQIIDSNLDTNSYQPCFITESLCTKLDREYYYCPRSKTCIKKSKLCDGIPHCFYGDDEDFDICSEMFRQMWPASATIKCIEANRSELNITILATPCDNIRECRDGEDEDFCSELELVKWVVQFVFIISIFGVWLSTYFLARRRNLTQVTKKSYGELNEGKCFDMKGEELAILKVH